VTIVRQPTRAGVRDAAAKIAAILPQSPVLTAEIKGVTIAFKAECLQPIGSFKLRGAWHRLTALDEGQRTRGVVAFSSGNHAQGVAWAARRLGMPAVIVMPEDAPKVKRDATLAMGAEIVAYDRHRENREKIAAHLAHARGATLVPSFDDPWVIEGQGSAGIELQTQMIEMGLNEPVRVLVPCGGGGLASGIGLALPDTEVVTVEPEHWDDMRRGLESGWIERVADDAPPTACDALMTREVSPLTFEVLARRDAKGLAVNEEEIRNAQRWAARNLRLVVEPGGAVAIAALLSGKAEALPGTAVIVSGGNADPEAYAEVLAGEATVVSEEA
jgi:threonine dehydratase